MYDADLPIKPFIVDYRLTNKNGIRKTYSYFMMATSRKHAEKNTRDLEHSYHINIVKITPIIHTREFHDAVDEAVATLKYENFVNSFTSEEETTEI